MKQKAIKCLNQGAKAIKVTGQAINEACLEDCKHENYVYVVYPAPYTGCWKSEKVVTDSYYDQETTSWF